jgi:hypothetical protein
LPLTRLSEAQHTVVESAMAVVGIV